MTQSTTTPQPIAPHEAVPETNEITFDGMPGVGTAHVPAAGAPEEVQATGPVDFVPGLPGAGAPPPPAAPRLRRPRTTREPRTPLTPQQRAARLGTGLAVLGLALLEVGLLLGFGATRYWSTVSLWSAFVTLAALLVLLPFAGRRLGLRPDAAWKVAAGGLTGAAVFWVLVVLPQVASDRGFVLTAGLAALGAALWVAPSRRA
ncbi:hypothetical protein [Geodermatophilus sp. CPCC 205506]|uniref:hypothetical protein n=1 Tax=Geodermatophilus sp. CPCC 205506 TaxID=2936596 RepID=UPI003EEB24A4